jgi:DNA (cytosine-5)-methyltransferase 1
MLNQHPGEAASKPHRPRWTVIEGGTGKEPLHPYTTLDLSCGAGGLTEGFREAGFRCMYGNDIMAEAIRSFAHNHPEAIADNRPVEQEEPAEIRARPDLAPGELDVLAGGPPCQGFSINVPERFLDDPRNKLFKHYAKFLAEFRPKTFVFENVPGLLSLADGKVFRQVLRELAKLDYQMEIRILCFWTTEMLGSAELLPKLRVGIPRDAGHGNTYPTYGSTLANGPQV